MAPPTAGKSHSPTFSGDLSESLCHCHCGALEIEIGEALGEGKPSQNILFGPDFVRFSLCPAPRPCRVIVVMCVCVCVSVCVSVPSPITFTCISASL